jgi:mono/diheme cytochrome c family protein
MTSVVTTAQETTTPGATTTPQFDGKWRYRMNCAGCHGNDGTGYYAFGPALKGNAFVQNAPAAALIQVIQKGRNYKERSHLAYVGMPAYQWIRGGEADALVQYMKGELQK